MPSYTIRLSSATVRSIAASAAEVRAHIAQDLLKQGSGLVGILSHYCRDDLGTATDSSVSIDPEYMDILEDLTGTATVEFQESAYYGCDNQNVLEDHEVEIPFRIDIEASHLVLDVPESSRISDFHRGFDSGDET